jgi:hypothetical protein
MPLRRPACHALVVVLGVLVAGGCETPPTNGDTPEVTYRHLPKLTFNVARIEIEQTYRPPLRPPNVEHLFPESPGELAQRWAEDRLVADGTSGTLRYRVRQASVIETQLETKEDLGGVFTVEQSERYDARLVVLVVLLDAYGVERAHASVQADRWITVAEDTTVVERERIWFQMAEKLVNDMGVELEARMRDNMDRYIRP